MLRSIMIGLAALLLGILPARADGPARVVSLNLCTDQLAMRLAAPGQLVAVSPLAADPRSSAMAAEAGGYPVTAPLAEQVYLLEPDLVLAGAFTTRATVDMLSRLGVRVETFDLATSMDDIRDRIAQMGRALGREDAAAAEIAAFDARLEALRNAATGPRPRAALYAANGYTSGDRSLAGQILAAAGYDNVATEAGFSGGGQLPLEMLALADPDLLIASRPYPGASRAEEILAHPVVRQLSERVPTTALRDAAWVCGTPRVLDAVADLVALRGRLDGTP